MNPFLFLDFISLYCPRSKFFSNDCFSCHSFDFFLTNTNTYLYKQNTLTIKITRKSGILNRLSQHLIFLCKFCHYTTSNKKDYEKHTMTLKHKKLANGNDLEKMEYEIAVSYFRNRFHINCFSFIKSLKSEILFFVLYYEILGDQVF
jgi:hypothetical protein